MTWGTVAVGLTSAILVFAGTWLSAKRAERTAKTVNETAMIEQQRKAFEAMMDPLQQQVNALQGRVDVLETEVRKERDLRERIVSYARSILWAWRRQFPDHPPPVPPDSIAHHFD